MEKDLQTPMETLPLSLNLLSDFTLWRLVEEDYLARRVGSTWGQTNKGEQTYHLV
jgi:hypothetical protein